MRAGRLRSLQLRLAIRLALVYVAATAVMVGVLVFRAYETAETLNDRELSRRAEDLGRSVSVDDQGNLRVRLSPRLAAAYAAGAEADIYAIRTSDRRILAASPASFGERVANWPAPTDDPSYFHLTDLGHGARDYYGLSLALMGTGGPLWISVAQADGEAALVDSLLWEFLIDIAWVVPILVGVTVLIGILAIRSGLAPVRIVSEQAAAIGPSATAVRLPEHAVPSEIERRWRSDRWQPPAPIRS